MNTRPQCLHGECERCPAPELSGRSGYLQKDYFFHEKIVRNSQKLEPCTEEIRLPPLHTGEVLAAIPAAAESSGTLQRCL